MNMMQYKDYGYADSDKLNFQDNKAEQTVEELERQQQREEELLQKLNAGEISQAEYDTLTTTNAGSSPGISAEMVSMPSTYKIDETYWTDQLTEEDIQYLMLKWGTMYTPEE